MIGLIEHLGQIFRMRINLIGFKKHWTYYRILR